ncbi:hypothetical protein CIPAW_14G061500 [Carya illinoinensis]|uniref:No apical meristem-associated C-terminal domain-containing protein n=1 Tax=Carya illinoinensis TaxID=32201 RepID=A0A8T1NJ24_CARIL|nr:hypothetical protein CIPAW_14G061500 [Carya illinoinensis]
MTTACRDTSYRLPSPQWLGNLDGQQVLATGCCSHEWVAILSFVFPFGSSALIKNQTSSMYFTNLLSQDPQLDPIYGGQSGSSPLTLHDSPTLPPNEPIGVRKSVRGANFTSEEDKLLVSAWLNCSFDAKKFFEYFQQFKETTTERTIKSLIHRWSFDKAKVMYQALEKCSFQFEHCWHLLKDQPKKTMSPSPTPTRCSGATIDEAFDMEADEVMENEVIELERPIGRKAEKGKRKAQGRQTEENFQLRKMKYTLLEESHVQEKEFYRMKAEKMELEAEKMVIERENELAKIRQEDERLRLEAQKVLLATKDQDQRIMMMDVGGMPKMQRLYFQQLQREIMVRRNTSQD